MSLDTDFQAKLAALVGAGVPVQQNYTSVDKIQPRVWYQRRSGNTELLLFDAGTAGIETVYEVEVNGLDPDAAAAIAATLTTALNGFRGSWGSSVILGAFVEDAADDYIPRVLEIDDGYHVFAFNVRVLQ